MKQIIQQVYKFNHKIIIIQLLIIRINNSITAKSTSRLNKFYQLNILIFKQICPFVHPRQVYLVNESSGDSSTSEAGLLWRKRGESPAASKSTWRLASVDIPAAVINHQGAGQEDADINPTRFVLEAVRGRSFRSDIAIDDIKLFQGTCTYSPERWYC